MIDLEISGALLRARIQAIIDTLATGGPAQVLFYTGDRPAAGQAPAGAPVVAMAMPNPLGDIVAPGADFPAGFPVPPLACVASGIEAMVTAQGDITWARILDGAGDEHLRCNVGVTGSGALIQVDRTTVYTGGYLKLTKFWIY